MSTLQSLEQLFRYTIIGQRPVGRGGCGYVWQANDLLYGRTVALKTIADEVNWNHPELSQRTFRKEAIAAARLGELSPFILPVTDIGVIDRTLYYVMQWLAPPQDWSGIDLSERAGHMSLVDAKRVMSNVCDAVTVAHDNGIVHSDIAPHNIVFNSADSRFMLADFGLLKIVEEKLLSAGSGSLLQGGRKQYFPPEVRDDISKVSYASDVYALAVTFRVLLEGNETPLSGKTPAIVRIRHEQRDAPDSVRKLIAKYVDSFRHDISVSSFITDLRQLPS